MAEEWISLTQAVERTAVRLGLSIGLARVKLWREALADGVRLRGEQDVTYVLRAEAKTAPTGDNVVRLHGGSGGEWQTSERREFVELEGMHTVMENFAVYWDTDQIAPGWKGGTEWPSITKLQVNAADLESWLEQRSPMPQPESAVPDQQTPQSKRNGGAPALPIKADYRIQLDILKEKRSSKWISGQTTPNLRRVLQDWLTKKGAGNKPPARSTLNSWIDQWRSEHKL
jgi:hypothetical protein